MSSEAPEKGIVYVMSAPSGAGKTTLCRMAVDFFPDLRHSISYTTRKPREGDRNGVDYWFVDDAEFDRMIEAGEFLEHAAVYGKRYGTSKKALEGLVSGGLSVMLEIDVQGAATVRQRLKGAVHIFVLPPSLKACEQRLRARGKDSVEEIGKRLRIAAEEVKRASEYDYIIINDAVERAFDELKSIVIAERARAGRMLARVERAFTGA